jgi:hypothetical protein
MPNQHPSLIKLTNCINACNGDKACIKACQGAFVAEGGKVFASPEGGKVFTAPDGGKVFGSIDGGKVFATPEGGKVVAEGGKVF